MKFLALLVVSLLGCGDNLPDPTQPHSGSRLKLAWYEYDGGARELETAWYFDSTLGERCTSTQWSDGHRYCAPAADEAIYVNDTCTEALGRSLVGAVSAASFFATTFRGTGASVGIPSRLFRRGEATVAPAEIWQNGTDGCIRTDIGSGFEYFKLDTEIPIANLVRLRRSDPADPYGTGDFEVIDEIGDDGLQVPASLYDRADKTECTTVDLPEAVSAPCAPVTTARAAVYFLDPACSDLVVAVSSGTSPALVSLDDAGTSCTTYYHVGRGIGVPSSQLLFQENGTKCDFVPTPDGEQFFELGERAYLPALGRVRDAGRRRIHAITRVNGALQLHDPWMYDAELETECRHDDEMDCVPFTVGTVAPSTVPTYYADAQCQSPIGLALVPRGTCDPPVRFATDGADYYELREPYTKPIYVRSTGDTCGNYVPPESNVAYQIDAPVPRSAFPHAKLVIDP